MNKLSVRKLASAPLEAVEVPSLMDSGGVEYNRIDRVDWPDSYPYAPEVKFRIAHTGSEILLHFVVTEDSVRAVAPNDNGNVWEDSCCEFFSVPANDGVYYNVECNCAGTLLVGCGPGREHRELAPQQVLDKVRRWSSLGNGIFQERKGHVQWQMALIVPSSVYFRHSVESLSGCSMTANFYKCGDKLERPHFLSWSPIATEQPDFHRPEYFGELYFE